jgi:NADPH-dependent 2,4-dienoyl-CoA reductase/sulfur reductase-like enzyme/nitrite reductase/ring-hydroxylating ferredoxin subunit
VSESTSGPTGPDLTAGVELAQLADGGMLLGQAAGEAVLLARSGENVFAVGATCTHYSGPLADGLVVDGQVRCPWHHACFDLASGEPVGAPALNPIACWDVERSGGRVFVRGKRARAAAPAGVAGPASVVILGAGAAGNAAAEMLRRAGYRGPVTMIGAEPPVDRPNLSKDYLAGTAPEEWIPLRGAEFYAEQQIALVVTRATAIDPAGKSVTLADGTHIGYGALLLATGAQPTRLAVPGADLPHVHTLRSLVDSRAIIAAATGARRAVVVGASFIGLEAAASLRARNVEVHVVAPGGRPLERVMGPELGDFIRALHEEHGVVFHMGRRPSAIDADAVTLDDGTRLEADLVVAGIGVRPATALAADAGLHVDDGVVTDEQLRTSAPGIWAAGDIARYPDRRGRPVRIEHWVVAERQGQAAARNLLGAGEPFRVVPFFWSQHYDVPINYVGHASQWDHIDVYGDLAGRNALVAFREGGTVAAVASIYRDRESLQIEAAMERGDDAAVEALLAAAK